MDATGRRVLGPVGWLVVRLAAGFREYLSKRYPNGVEHYRWFAVVFPVPLLRPAGRGYFAGLLVVRRPVTLCAPGVCVAE